MKKIITLFAILYIIYSVYINFIHGYDGPEFHKIEEILSFKDNIIVFSSYVDLESIKKENNKSNFNSYIYKICNKILNELFHINGSLLKYSIQNNEKLYILGSKYLQDNNVKSFLIVSDDLNKGWNYVNIPNDKIVGIDFSNKLYNYIWSNRSIFRSDKDIANWEKLFEADKIFYFKIEPKIDNHGNIWLSYGDNFIKIDKDGKRTYIKFPFQLNIRHIAFDSENNLWVIAYNKNNLFVFKMQESYFEEVVNFPYHFPEKFYVGEKKVVIFGSNINGFFLDKDIIYSTDNGVSWKKYDNIARLGTFRLLCMQDDDNIFSYNSFDKIQKIKLD